MGVYIKGMEMPKSCSDCPMLDWDLDYIKCKVTGRHFKVKEEPFGARRVDDCPLVPVPPHGRLLNVLKTERECVSRDCDRNCGKCELSLEQSEILSAYDTLISMLSDPAEEGET